METIERRAEKLAAYVIRRINEYAYKNGKSIIPAHNESVNKVIETAYTVGAKDQRKIDIDKACEWLRKQTDQEYPGAPHLRIFDDYDINEFRKAMEE